MLVAETPQLPTDSLGKYFLLCGSFSSFTTPSLGQVSISKSFIFVFIFYLLSYLLVKTLGYLYECLVSFASVEKLFCGSFSIFKWSFDEFVGEKVVAPSCSSAILEPPPVSWFYYILSSSFNIGSGDSWQLLYWRHCPLFWVPSGLSSLHLEARNHWWFLYPWLLIWQEILPFHSLCPWSEIWPIFERHFMTIFCHMVLGGLSQIGPKFFLVDMPLLVISRLDSVQFSSVAQSCPTLCDPMNHSTPGLPVHHQLPEFTQTHVHQVSDAIQPSYPLSSPSPPAPNPSKHQGLFQWVNSSHEVAKVLVSTLASVLPKKSQGWSPSEWTGWISLQSKGLSKSLLQHHS